MIDIKNIYLTMQYVLHIFIIINKIIVAIYEIHYINKYKNIDLILTKEVEIYNFSYSCSILNLLNCMFLLWILFDISNTKIKYYALTLFIINLLIGLWCMSLYIKIKENGIFNQIIIIQFNIFVIDYILLVSYLSFNYYNSLLLSSEYTIVLSEIPKDDVNMINL